MKKPHIEYKSDFNRVAWLIRITTMSIAFVALIIFLKQHNKRQTLLLKDQKIESHSSDSTKEMQIPVGRSKD